MSVPIAIELSGSDARVPGRPEDRPLRPGGEGLEALEPLLLAAPGEVSAAVVDGSGNVNFETRPMERYTLASVAKVYILVAFLDSVSREGRDPTDTEHALMHDMITWSDNEAATALWQRIGGGDGLQDYLARRGMLYPDVPKDGSWGDMQASVRDVATFLLFLHRGRLLEPRFTEIALGYLQDVSESQAWGVGTAREDGGGDSHVYFKNGWYPEESGWIMNSVGVVDAGACEYVIVILSRSQPSLEDGQAFLNRASSLFLQHYGELAAVDACRIQGVRSA